MHSIEPDAGLVGFRRCRDRPVYPERPTCPGSGGSCPAFQRACLLRSRRRPACLGASRVGRVDRPWGKRPLSQKAQGVTSSANFPNTPWGVYTVHFKDLALSGGGPNGPDTNQWTYILALQSNGTGELYGEEDMSQYPGHGTTNCVSRGIVNIGPNLTATWRVNGSTLRIGGPGYNWQDDSCEPGWHIYQPFSNEGASFTYQFYAGFTAVRLTYIGQGNFFPRQEGNTFIFRKIKSY